MTRADIAAVLEHHGACEMTGEEAAAVAVMLRRVTKAFPRPFGAHRALYDDLVVAAELIEGHSTS